MTLEKYRGKPHASTKLDDKGRIVIPKEVRKHLDSDEFVVVFDPEDGVRVEPVDEPLEA